MTSPVISGTSFAGVPAEEAMKVTDRRAMTVLGDEPQRSAASPVDVLLNAIQRHENMDVAKLERLMELAERWQAARERRAFVAALSAAKAKIKPIVKRHEVDFQAKNGGMRTNYKHEDFADVAEHVDPILAEHGLSYRHEPKQEGNKITITCILSHCEGHEERTSLTANNDETGNKNSIQGVGSTATYLQRYTVKLALGLAAARDTDGRQPASDDATPPSPDGYDDWRADMTALADEGVEKLQAAWRASDQDFRRHAIKHDDNWWSQQKKIAANADAAVKSAQQ